MPYVRGRERSRKSKDIISEFKQIVDEGYKDITLLGQNVNSYGKNLNTPISFAELLRRVEEIEGLQRIRFMTSHPKDMSNAVLYSMAMYPNICTHIHLPVQSGSDRMLEKMNRKYDTATYLERIDKIREIIPDAAITTDIIAGFCSETEEDHEATINLMKNVKK